MDGKNAVEVTWFDEDAWRDVGARRDERADFTHTVSVPLTPLPHRVGLSDLELGAQRRALARNMQDYEASIAAKRRADGSRRLPKPSKYTTQDPNGVSPGKRKKVKKPQPWAHGTDDEVRAYRDAYDRVMVAYDLASAEYRKSGVLCPFPAGTFPPRIPVPMEVT